MEKQRAEEEPARSKDASWGGAGGSGRTVPWSGLSEPLVCGGACFLTNPLWQSLHSLQQPGRWHEGKSAFGIKMSGEDCGKLESTESPKGARGAVPAQLQLISALRTHGWTRV